MKETSFIQQNKDKWKRFEDLNRSGQADPEELSRLFVEITEDLSYARTFYPKRSVRVYLNFLAQGVFSRIYKIKAKPFRKFAHFWTTGLPIELYRARKNLLYAFLFFAVAMIIGVVSTADDYNFARVILSDNYIEMTDQFISEGDPMAVYKKSDGLPMFLRIFFNNIQVAFYCFIMGIFFSIGTLFFLVYNGIMVGTFQSYFYFKGMALGTTTGTQLLMTSFLTIWIHGAFEISAIVIAGAAGITIGNGLLFPGTYTRSQSLQITGRRGMKIMIGLIPFFLIAAIFESWVTRYTEMPEAGKWLIILGSFFIVILYFIVLPIFVARRYPNLVTLQEEPVQQSTQRIELNKIRQFNELFSDSFMLMRKVWKFIMRPLFLVILPLNILLPVILTIVDYSGMDYSMDTTDALIQNFPNTEDHFWSSWITMFCWTLSLCSGIFAMQQYKSESKEFAFNAWWKSVMKSVLVVFPITLLFVFWLQNSNSTILFLGFILLPVLLYLPYSIYSSQKSRLTALTESFRNGFSNWANGFLLLLFFGLITFCVTLLVAGSGMLGNIIKEIIQWHFSDSYIGYNLVNNFTEGVLLIVFTNMVLPLILIGFAMLYYSYREKEEAIGLFRRMERFGKKSRNFETEYEHED